MSGAPIVAVESLRPISSGTLLWRRNGRLSLTVIAKATLGLAVDGPASLTAPVELWKEAKSFANGRALFAESDLVPFKPRAEVIYAGSAWAPRPVQALHARLGVLSPKASLEKAIQVVGDRASEGVQPAPFARMPITWERAWQGPQGENPLGVARGGKMANLFDTRNRERPVSFGAMSTAFPERARLFGATDLRSLTTPAPPPNAGGVWAIDLPTTLPFDVFMSAPTDQRLDRLRGDEQIILENLVEGQSRVSTVLPGIKGAAKVFGETLPPQGQLLELVLDTIVIDGEKKQLSLTFRGTLAVPSSESVVQSMRALVGVELSGKPLEWPTPQLRSNPSRQSIPHVELPPPADDGDGPTSGGSTQAISPEEAMKLLANRALPFGGAGPMPPPAPLPPPPAPPPPGSPPKPQEAKLIALPPGPSVVVRPPGAVKPVDDEDSVIGATMAISPEEAQAMISARKAANGPAPGPPPGPPPPPAFAVPTFPPPAAPPAFAPPPPAPPPFAQPVASRVSDEDPPASTSTVAFSPEAAQAMIAQRMKSLGISPPGTGPMPAPPPPGAGLVPPFAPPPPPPPAPPAFFPNSPVPPGKPQR